jgi:hypothetical protein
VNAYMKMKKRWDQASTTKSKTGHPVMMALGEGKTEKRCYGCWQFGHLRGDESCTAGKDAIWEGAPNAYLDKVQRRFGLTPNGSKRAASTEGKQICPYWSSGDGYCKYAERCKFEHSGPQGGSKRAREFGRTGKVKGKGKGKGDGKGKGRGKGRGGGSRTQKGTTMVVTKKSDGNRDAQEKSSSMVVRLKDEEDNSDEDDVEGDLYNLMRGHTAMMIAANSDTESDLDEENSDEESSDEESSEDDDLDLSEKTLQPDRNSSS